jgi:malonyl-CoA/methylmalonyl-CoA synthetase
VTTEASFPLRTRAHQHGPRKAIIDSEGTFTYNDLLDVSSRVATSLLERRADLQEERIAFLLTPGFPWVAVQWGIWLAGGIAVPLPLIAPPAELEYFIANSGASTLIYGAASADTLSAIAEAQGLRTFSYEQCSNEASAAQEKGVSHERFSAPSASAFPALSPERRAMILYTSGTTSRPKGVVTTHANVTAQIMTLVDAWEWSPQDRILLCLPLHHVHGVINILSCALWSGATCQMLPRFEATAVWDHFAAGHLTLFMAVPTIYAKLISAWEASSPQRRTTLSAASAKLRLMVSGSAALPVSTLERWKQISGHTLLERYGMTEIGMALANPLHGERLSGSVGLPLPGVDVRLTGENGASVPADTPGEIEVRSPSVFAEYWGQPQATREAFRDGWFRTGDTAIIEHGRYRILGRTNIDILKTGGHKVSALEIEEVLREHPAIAECAVVGVPDPEWGERVAAAIVLSSTAESLELDALRNWARQFLAAHKLPSRLLLLKLLPRNAMGKVTKPALTALFSPSEQAMPGSPNAQ